MKALLKILPFIAVVILKPEVINGQPGTVVQQVQGGVASKFIAISPDDRLAITEAGDVIDVKKGFVLHKGLSLGKVFMLNDNRQLVSLKQGRIQVIDYTSNSLKKSLLSNTIENYYNTPVSCDGRWYVHWNQREESVPITDETDTQNNNVLAKQTGQQDILNVIALPEGKWQCSISTGFSTVFNYALEGNILAVNGMDLNTQEFAIQFYDLQNGQKIKEQRADALFIKMLLNPTGEYFFSYSSDSNFIAQNIRTGKPLKSITAQDASLLISGGYQFSDDGKQLFLINVLIAGENPNIKIINLEQDVVTYETQKKGMLIEYTISPDLRIGLFKFYNTTLSGTRSELLNLQKTSTPPFILPIEDYHSWAFGNIFTHKGGHLIRFVRDYGNQTSTVVYYNLRQYRLEKSVRLLGLAQPNNISLLRATNELLFSYCGSDMAMAMPLLYKIRLGKSFGVSEVFEKDTCTQYAWHERSGLVAIQKTATYYDLSGKNSKTRDDTLNAYRVASSIAVKSIQSGSKIVGFPASTAYTTQKMCFDRSGRFLACLNIKAWQYKYKNGLPSEKRHDDSFQISVLDLEQKKTVATSIKIPPIHNIRSDESNLPAFILDSTLKHVYLFGFGNPKSQIGKPFTSDRSESITNIRKVDISTGKTTRCYGEKDVREMRYVTHSDEYIAVRIILTDNDDGWGSKVIVLDYELNPVLEISVPESSKLSAALDAQNTRLLLTVKPHPDYIGQFDSTFLFNIADARLLDEFRTPPTFQSEMVFTGNLCYFPNSLFDLGKKRTMLNWSVFAENNFIATTPENYYLTTKTVTEAMRFTRGKISLPFRQYDLIYNRPDKVLAALPDPNPELIDSYHKAYLKRLQKMGFREQDLSADADLPTLKVNAEGLPFETDKAQLALAIEASDPKFLLDRINVWVNDVPVYGRQGISLRGKNLRNWTQTLNIPLSAGDNQIQLSCLNEKGVESLLEDVYITCNAPARKPDLYVLTIGVSEYADPAMNLNYAAKDAADVAALFKIQQNQYGNIYTKNLLNRDATAARVQELKSWLAQTKTDDCVVLFVSGHGLLDDNLDYFLATHDVDFNHPKEKGIPYDALEDLLDGIPARQKLILMDACHSGELDKENVSLVKEQVTTSASVKFRAVNTRVQTKQIGLQNSFELMKELFVDLRRSSGATVISSAGGAEYAVEGDAWKNGVFTYSLVTGLRDKAADLNKDGAVMVSELQDYLGQRVSELTQGQQRPTFRAENVANDWRVW